MSEREPVDVSEVTAPEPVLTPQELVGKAIPVTRFEKPVVRGHMQCPLLVSDAERDDREVVEYGTDAAGNREIAAVHRYAEQVIAQPTECPTCGIFVERHMLVWHGANAGGHAEGRDCAIALRLRSDARYAPMFAKIDARRGAANDATIERLEAVLEGHEERARAAVPREVADERFVQMREAIENAPDDEAKNAARLALAKAYAEAP